MCEDMDMHMLICCVFAHVCMHCPAADLQRLFNFAGSNSHHGNSQSSAAAPSPAGTPVLVGAGLCGADGVLGRCLAYRLVLDRSADTKSEWVRL